MPYWVYLLIFLISGVICSAVTDCRGKHHEACIVAVDPLENKTNN